MGNVRSSDHPIIPELTPRLRRSGQKGQERWRKGIIWTLAAAGVAPNVVSAVGCDVYVVWLVDHGL